MKLNYSVYVDVKSSAGIIMGIPIDRKPFRFKEK